MKKFVLFVLFLSVAFFAYAQHDHSGMAQGEGCKDMMATHEKMMTDMKAMDAKLDELVAAMNSASGDKKVDAMGALLNEMVTQRRQMQGMLMSMHPMMAHSMMSGCGEHAEGGMGCCGDEKKDMACCSGDKKMDCCKGEQGKEMHCGADEKKDNQ